MPHRVRKLHTPGVSGHGVLPEEHIRRQIKGENKGKTISVAASVDQQQVSGCRTSDGIECLGMTMHPQIMSSEFILEPPVCAFNARVLHEASLRPSVIPVTLYVLVSFLISAFNTELCRGLISMMEIFPNDTM